MIGPRTANALQLTLPPGVLKTEAPAWVGSHDEQTQRLDTAWVPGQGC